MDALEIKIKSLEVEIAMKEGEISAAEENLQRTLQGGTVLVILIFLGIIPLGFVLLFLSEDTGLPLWIVGVVLVFAPVIYLISKTQRLSQEKAKKTQETRNLRQELSRLLHNEVHR